jgi:hypothetical protein
MEDFRRQPGRGVLVPIYRGASLPAAESGEDAEIRRAMGEELSQNLELEPDALFRRLVARGIIHPDLRARTAELIGEVRKQAMFNRVRQELESGHPGDMNSLRENLLPISFQTGVRNQAWQEMAATLPAVESYEAIAPKTRLPAPDLPRLMSQDGAMLPIPALANAADYVGFVAMPRSDDGKMRSVALFAEYDGRLVPQLGLALACAQLGVNINDVRITRDSVTIPRPGGDTVIPVYTRQTEQGEMGLLMDIPWFGDSRDHNGWLRMYDWPTHQTPAQHLPMSNIWDICQIGPDIVQNNRSAMEDVAYVTGFFSGKPAADIAQVRKNAPPFDDGPAWNKLMADTLDNLPPGTVDNYKDYLEGSKNPDALQDANERNLVYALRNLQPSHRPQTNRTLAAEQTALRNRLARIVGGKAVLTGWIASGDTDFWSTPLFTECPGVVIHGAVFNAILTGDFKRPAPPWTAVALTCFVGLIVTIITVAMPPVRGLLVTVAVVAIFIWLDFSVGYDRFGIEADAAGPITAAGLICFVCLLARASRQWTLVRYILAGGSIEGQYPR